MKKLNTILFILTLIAQSYGQGEYKAKFEQMGTMLPTPNSYRTASGAPGENYWQQQADYDIDVELNDENQSITGSETITYTNNSPQSLNYLWVQLEQNMRRKDSDTYSARTNSQIPDTVLTVSYTRLADLTYTKGYEIKAVKDTNGKPLGYKINKTMMRVELPKPIKAGESFSFSIDWNYDINDRMMGGGRSGYEYFPKDNNYLYAIAQWFPRMAVYDDVNGWQHKQFLGRGEFTLPFGNYKVRITVPADHILGATGVLQNPGEVLTTDQVKRFEIAKNSSELIIIASQKEAEKREKSPNYKEKSTWEYHAENVRDFAFASSRKFIWDAKAVDINGKKPLAMSYYPKEGNPLWEQESTKAVANTLKGYSKFTIDYPYPVAISVHTASIGMEYPMICFNYGRPNEDGTYSDNKKWGMIGVIVHEVGHNFFPMIINSDERQWTWMDEGLNSFVQHLTQLEYYPDKPVTRGTPETITQYMKGSKEFIRPIMTNSEQIQQFGNNAYSKPSAALVLLRETIMGEELFDYAFKEYSKRWAFKHPGPADLFRTLEDASAVDLDWFWKGWFYSIDHVDVSVENVRWSKMKSDEKGFENRVESTQIASGKAGGKDGDKKKDFTEGFDEFTLMDSDSKYYGEFMNQADDDLVRKNIAGKNLYTVTFKNEGGLVTPIIIEWTYRDGSKEIETLPVEIWRMNENEITKIFVKDKEVINVKIDPDGKLADTETDNNNFPRIEEESKFDKFKKGDN